MTVFTSASSPTSRRILTAAIAGASAIVLTACGGTDDGGANQPPSPTATVPTETTNTETVTKTESPDPTTTPPETCDVPYEESDFGAVTSGRSFTVTDYTGANQSGFAWWAEGVALDGYDACEPLSYLALDGMVGDNNGPTGTGASISELLVLFADGETVSNPIPILFAAVEDVQRNSPESITVTYGHRGGATAEGVNEFYDVTYTLTDGQVEVARANVPNDVWEGYYRVRVP